ncbi:MAG: agglutinin biogenesis protein MshI [Gammaproteobacteria bacterium]|jgi:MSHA biogenesis protein MshI
MDAASYQLLLVEAPDVGPAELRAAVRWRIKDLISFHIDDAVIDVFEIPGQTGTAQARMMYAVAARATRVQATVDAFEDSGLFLDIIDIPEMCLRNVASLLPQDVDGLATLYLTRDYGLITLTRQGTLYLARRLEVGERALSAADDPDRREALLGNIVLEIQRSLDYYESHFSQPAIGTLAIAPTETETGYLNTYLDANIDIDIAPLDINDLVAGEVPLERAEQARCLLAIGAALRTEEVAL